MSSHSRLQPRDCFDYVPIPALGGIPTPIPDIPISAVLLALFVLGGALHIGTLAFNLRLPRRHKFPLSGAVGAFCVIRTVALALRIGWSRNQHCYDISAAATIFTSLGVFVLLIVNLLLVSRVVRALHPVFGWSKPALWGFRGVFGSLLVTLIMVLSWSVAMLVRKQDEDTREKGRTVLLVTGVYATVMALLPALVVAWAKMRRHRGMVFRAERFGTGPMWVKMAMIVVTSVLLAFGAGWRVAVSFFPMTPESQDKWFRSRAAFYCVNFGVELVMVYSYAILRFDQRFHVPDGASAPGHYSKDFELDFEGHEMDPMPNPSGDVGLADVSRGGAMAGATGDGATTGATGDGAPAGDSGHGSLQGGSGPKGLPLASTSALIQRGDGQ
ncbi:hypothetical protein N658DRAFT_221798 [Parathielavia hyrcaniae]|uniref:Uncharacterized protein n=1 Tax=Parathielavia hyrcaniae TaxID=113614 RepID=A0AAN6PUV4_9PEZI|nr:hypothetical protein N658DRAFT_221798 [Parathielavia hyrcaniae]